MSHPRHLTCVGTNLVGKNRIPKVTFANSEGERFTMVVSEEEFKRWKPYMHIEVTIDKVETQSKLQDET